MGLLNNDHTVNLDEFTVWQWFTVRDTQSHPTLKEA
jgi:hypothetical protein